MSADTLTVSARTALDAELNARVAHLYGLAEDEFVLIMNAAPNLPAPIRVAARNLYRDMAHGILK